MEVMKIKCQVIESDSKTVTLEAYLAKGEYEECVFERKLFKGLDITPRKFIQLEIRYGVNSKTIYIEQGKNYRQYFPKLALSEKAIKAFDELVKNSVSVPDDIQKIVNKGLYDIL